MPETLPTSSPHEIGGYTIIEPLREDQTYLAAAPGGRKLVLKMLPADCLLEDQLHPAIYERLARVRELAERNISNLHGVERDGAYTFLVWDYVAGTALSESAAAKFTYRDLLRISRELVLTIESLHGAGIVHGALKPGNVIFDRDESRVRVTHVSPLLHNDSQRDTEAIAQLLLGLLESRKDRESPLGAVLQQSRTQRHTLRQLSSLLANVPEPGQSPMRRGDITPRKPVRGIARRALWGAVAIAVIGIGASAVAWWYVQRANDPYRLMRALRRPSTTQPAASPTTTPTASTAPGGK